MLKKLRKLYLLLIVTALLSTTAWAENPYSKADGTWISISGTVDSITTETFLLDYGENVITVEMDDWDWYPETAPLRKGDKVTVYGLIDNDFFETASIEANSVYVERFGSFFYASSVDEEGDYFYSVPTPVIISSTNIIGRVTSVNGDEFTVDVGSRKMTVETDEMAYNPLDSIGFLKVKVGDRVSVVGQMDYDLFEGRELVADSITILRDSSK